MVCDVDQQVSFLEVFELELHPHRIDDLFSTRIGHSDIA